MDNYSENRPWGKFERLTLNEPTTIKVITINQESKTSLQKHKKRDEFWRVIKGSCKVIIGKKELNAKIGDEFEISKGTLHRIIGTKNLCNILEISFGDFDENDIERIEDDYNRVK